VGARTAAAVNVLTTLRHPSSMVTISWPAGPEASSPMNSSESRTFAKSFCVVSTRGLCRGEAPSRSDDCGETRTLTFDGLICGVPTQSAVVRVRVVEKLVTIPQHYTYTYVYAHAHAHAHAHLEETRICKFGLFPLNLPPNQPLANITCSRVLGRPLFPAIPSYSQQAS